MVTRLISASASETLSMSSEELKQSIKASEGRVIMSENLAPHIVIGDITNAELAKAFGADMILLNGFNMEFPEIEALTVNEADKVIKKLREYTGTPIGVNLEPIDTKANMLEDRLELPKGRLATKENIEKANKLGFDFISLTGNPGTGVTNKKINNTIKLVKDNFNGLIIAGKMHGAGVNESIINLDMIETYIQSGVDILLLPAVGTVPGVNEITLEKAVKLAHKHNVLTMSAIGTSQEGASKNTIEDIALRNKICGVDIQHIGDAGYSGLAPIENIYTLSVAIRGRRHTAARMARSVKR